MSFQDQKSRLPRTNDAQDAEAGADMFPISTTRSGRMLVHARRAASGSSGVVEHTLDLDSAEAQHREFMFFAVLHTLDHAHNKTGRGKPLTAR